MKKLRAIVSGRVQGVGFRYFVKQAARELGLCGYAMNTHDGNVEVEAEGPEDKLEQLRLQLLKGPALSRVVDVKDSMSEGKGEFSGFDIR